MFGFDSLLTHRSPSARRLRNGGLRHRVAAVSINQRPPKPATCRASRAWWHGASRPSRPGNDPSLPRIGKLVACSPGEENSPQPCTHGCTLRIGNGPPCIHRSVHAPVHARAPRTRRTRRTTASSRGKLPGAIHRRAARAQRRAGRIEFVVPTDTCRRVSQRASTYRLARREGGSEPVGRRSPRILSHR